MIPNSEFLAGELGKNRRRYFCTYVGDCWSLREDSRAFGFDGSRVSGWRSDTVPLPEDLSPFCSFHGQALSLSLPLFIVRIFPTVLEFFSLIEIFQIHRGIVGELSGDELSVFERDRASKRARFFIWCSNEMYYSAVLLLLFHLWNDRNLFDRDSKTEYQR